MPSLIVLHYTAMDSAERACAWLCSEESQVSAHYLIAEDGQIIQMVDEEKRAWHAGVGQWGDITDVNSHSIGIELANTGYQPFPDPQMRALEGVLPVMMKRWDIPPKGVIGHSDMAPGRKIDPGGRFDWRRLARGGLSIWPEPLHAADLGGFDADLATFGMRHPADEKIRLTAFRSRFAPHLTGPAGPQDAAIAAALARSFPVDAPRFAS